MNWIAKASIRMLQSLTSRVETKPGHKATHLSLREIHRTHVGKVSDKWSGFFDVYDRLFPILRDKNLTLLEIGIQNGGSLEVWLKYFHNCKRIIGADIDPKCAELRFNDPRLSVVVGDINDAATRAALYQIEPSFDLILDDGSHKSGDIIRTFCNLFDRLDSDGIYIVEDVCCSYWSAFDGGLHHPSSAMAFFKRLADCINSEHWGNDQVATSLLTPILDHYGTTISEDLVANVHSIEFANAMIVIRKAPAQKNKMGKRVVGGQIAQVNPAVLALDGTSWVSDERDNPFAYDP